jgi:hypothetical protein
LLNIREVIKLFKKLKALILFKSLDVKLYLQLSDFKAVRGRFAGHGILIGPNTSISQEILHV